MPAVKVLKYSTTLEEDDGTDREQVVPDLDPEEARAGIRTRGRPD